MKELDYKFDFIASTGRTATTYIAAILNSFDGVAGCHEGYLDSDKSQNPTLELINLENNQAYKSEKLAFEVVEKKRSRYKFIELQKELNVSRIIDVAYYNCSICTPLLSLHEHSRMLGIIRDCESFVRSATTIFDEDPLPVGWPDPNKSLTPREKFISMGRIRPRSDSSEFGHWNEFGAIHRNIWLWKETNKLLCEAKVRFPSRVCMGRFESFQSDQHHFWNSLIDFFDLPQTEIDRKNARSEKINKKPFGYQIGPASTWTTTELDYLHECQSYIDELVSYDF